MSCGRHWVVGTQPVSIGEQHVKERLDVAADHVTGWLELLKQS